MHFTRPRGRRGVKALVAAGCHNPLLRLNLGAISDAGTSDSTARFDGSHGDPVRAIELIGAAVIPAVDR
jgi:hypothetical protein